MSRRACAKKRASSGSAGRKTTPRRAPRGAWRRLRESSSCAGRPSSRARPRRRGSRSSSWRLKSPGARPTPRVRGNVRAFAEAARQRLRAGERLLVAGASSGETERLAEILGEYEIPYRFGTPAGQRPGLVEEKSVLAPPLAGPGAPGDAGG